MSPKKRIEIDDEDAEEAAPGEPGGGAEGEQGPEEASIGPSPELERAMQEAAESVGGPRGPEPREGESPEGSEVAAELEETRDRLLRLQADFENFRRRALREKTEAHQYGHQNLVKDLLSTVDNLERAIDHARRSGGEDLESLLHGVELVHRELLAGLAKHGVAPIEALGKPFDPALHEAMAQTPDASVAPNTVVEELQKGYLLRDRLLRPSRVVVARAPDEAPGTDRNEGEEAPS